MGKEKKQKLKEKLKLLEKCCNRFIADSERLEKELHNPIKKIKKPPTEPQKRVQANFARRAKYASRIYNAPGNKLSWGECMTAAGTMMKAEDEATAPAESLEAQRKEFAESVLANLDFSLLEEEPKNE
jgi:hypothetical protein